MSEDRIPDLMRGIVSGLVEAPPSDWDALAVVVIPYPHNQSHSHGSVRETYGYVYLSDGGLANGAVRPDVLSPAAQIYLDSLYGPDDPWPVRFLVQYDRIVKDVLVTLEDTDESRWNTTMDKLAELPGMLRPNFSEGH